MSSSIAVLESEKKTMPTTRIALVLEYNGANYCGSQWQDGSPTIQGEMEKALLELTGESVRIAMAGRTDSGVHAKGQVAGFQTGSSLFQGSFVSGLNYYLPADIAVKAAHIAGETFDVRRSAVSREYRYSLLNSRVRSPLRDAYAFRITGDLDIDMMNRACQEIIGEHDFASFASGIGGESKSTVRRMYRAEVTREGDIIGIDMVANAFVRHQVRSTAGCLVRIGLGKMGLDEFRSIIEARQPGLAGPTLPACGLCLLRVNYPHPLEEETEL